MRETFSNTRGTHAVAQLSAKPAYCLLLRENLTTQGAELKSMMRSLSPLKSSIKSPSCVDRIEDAAVVRTEPNQVVDVVEIAVAQLSAEPTTSIGQDLTVRFVASASNRKMYGRA